VPPLQAQGETRKRCEAVKRACSLDQERMFVWRIEHTSANTRRGRRQASLTYASNTKPAWTARARTGASQSPCTRPTGPDLRPPAFDLGCDRRDGAEWLLSHVPSGGVFLERLPMRTALSCRPRVQGTPGPTQSSPACQVARAHAVRACLRRITKLSARISVDYGAQSRRVLTIRARYFFRWGPSPISTLRPPLLSERRPFGAGNPCLRSTPPRSL